MARTTIETARYRAIESQNRNAAVEQEKTRREEERTRQMKWCGFFFLALMVICATAAYLGVPALWAFVPGALVFALVFAPNVAVTALIVWRDGNRDRE